MKDKKDDVFFNGEDKTMLASNLAASLNIPPDITITAVSVPAKTMTPPPLLPVKSHQVAMNLMSNTSTNHNINNPACPVNMSTSNFNSSGSSASRNSPMNFSLNSPNNPVNVTPKSQTSVMNLNASNQISVPSSSNQNNQLADQSLAQMSPSQNLLPAAPGHSKYSQLLDVIEEIGKDVRPTYSGSKSSAERLRRSIGLARILIRQCIMETEPNMKS